MTKEQRSRTINDVHPQLNPVIINENMNEYHTISTLGITTTKPKMHATRLFNQLLTSRLILVDKQLITSHRISTPNVQNPLQKTLCKQALQTTKADIQTRVCHVAHTIIGSPMLRR